MTAMIFDDLSTRILLAVIAGGTNGTSIARTVGCDRLAVHRRLHDLRDQGLVTWRPGTQGTIRPLVREVEIRR